MPGSEAAFPPLLPVLSLALFAAAAFAALWALNTRPVAAERAGPWDLAGALVFLGCAAAMLGEVNDLIEYWRPSQPRKPEPARG